MDGESTRLVVDRVVADVGGAFTSGLAYIGDRLGLFRELGERAGACSSTVLAERLGLNERYVREWLRAMVSAGYVEAGQSGYFMTPAQKAVLADEGSPVFALGAFQFALPSLGLTSRLLDCFRAGGGIAFSDLGAEIGEAIDRMHRPWFEHHLTQRWLASVPGMNEGLRAGGRVLDVGCGLGRSTIAMARAWPRSEILGVDPDPASITRARKLESEAGTGARFEEAALEALPDSESFDLIVAIDCIHDMADPVGALGHVRRLLSESGVFFWSEPTGSEDPAANRGPVEKMRAGLSPYHCLTVSLAEGGQGLGTIIGETGARRLAGEAGFTNFRKLPIESRMQQFFLLKK